MRRVPHQARRDGVAVTTILALSISGSAGAQVLESRGSIDCQASLQQMSGEDWTNVRLTLSTATPALVASAPVLEPLPIVLASAQQGAAAPGGGGAYADAERLIDEQRRQAEDGRNMMAFDPSLAATAERGPAPAFFSAQALADGAIDRSDGVLDRAAAEGRMLDALTRERVLRRDKPAPATHQPSLSESVSVTCSIQSRTSVANRDDPQLIQMARIEAPSQFYKVATPVLTSSVFDEAIITNSSNMVLLAGPSAGDAGGELVGRGAVPTASIGQTFTGGFGIDSSLRASRELVERSETTQGGNRVVDFTDRLSLANFSATPVAVRLMDRLPDPKGSDIKLTLLSSGDEGQPLSTDATDERTQRKKGILRWDLAVPPHRTASDPCTLEYRFQLEYDRRMTITNAPA